MGPPMTTSQSKASVIRQVRVHEQGRSRNRMPLAGGPIADAGRSLERNVLQNMDTHESSIPLTVVY